MLFRKRRDKSDKDDGPKEAPIGSADEEVVETAKTSFGRFTIIPRVKQLVNGRWIARITLEEDVVGGSRSYDFAGPMTEFEGREEAARGGVEHAKQRLSDGL